jgi:hypothetical protein
VNDKKAQYPERSPSRSPTQIILKLWSLLDDELELALGVPQHSTYAKAVAYPGIMFLAGWFYKFS